MDKKEKLKRQREATRRYRLKYPERSRQSSKMWRLNNPESYKKSYTKTGMRGLKLKKCKCGCNNNTLRTFVMGHHLRLNPKPENLGKYLKGTPGDQHWNWKGGIITPNGYIYIHKPKHPNATKQGYVCEHRLVMENKIGRYLKRKEVVHHIDQNRLNNKIKNLILVKNQSDHLKFHNHKRTRKKSFSRR